MAAKLKIAATLARNADICMLDEPLNGIDLVGRDQIIQSILRAANPNATILISSHLFDELEPIVDHIVMMANGSLILEGELERDPHTVRKVHFGSVPGIFFRNCCIPAVSE